MQRLSVLRQLFAAGFRFRPHPQNHPTLSIRGKHFGNLLAQPARFFRRQRFFRRRKFFSVKVTDDLFLKVFVFVIFGSLSVWFVFC